MLNHAITLLNHALTWISMQEWHVGRIIWLIKSYTNLRILRLLQNQKIQLKTSFLALLSSFLSLFSLLFFLCFCGLVLPLERAEIPLNYGQEWTLVHSFHLWLEFMLSAPIKLSQNQTTWPNLFLPFASLFGPMVLSHFLPTWPNQIPPFWS